MFLKIQVTELFKREDGKSTGVIVYTLIYFNATLTQNNADCGYFQKWSNTDGNWNNVGTLVYIVNRCIIDDGNECTKRRREHTEKDVDIDGFSN